MKFNPWLPYQLAAVVLLSGACAWLLNYLYYQVIIWWWQWRNWLKDRHIARLRAQNVALREKLQQLRERANELNQKG